MISYIQPEDRIDCAAADNNCEGEVTRTNLGADWLCASHRGFAYVMDHQVPDTSNDREAPLQQRRVQYTKDLEDLLRRIINLNIPPRCCRFSTTILVKKGHASGCLVIQAKDLLERTGTASTEPEAA